ncbi:hypothetical protein [Marinilactibacillus psychrotolerans]|uniref:Uncharacterized protein n=1 Tax=Marinilactibacillus psychrotolerans TaxID=191770 RepID=A0AAV3WV66_9LACT|nr:hypothetical protein [Marinilactibacillus psychrotolerans]GEL67269.1 hypothetical protein MPS01_14240 [Marinilactibacillus psychrotolerans]GEQ36073.1 hypothetical protein M132T_15810 [Marinilactibacillus psychrotolerans]SDC62476.1 hypothetical protein SAMN04488013_10784 [Marinilactibacillus psychrotolerans]
MDKEITSALLAISSLIEKYGEEQNILCLYLKGEKNSFDLLLDTQCNRATIKRFENKFNVEIIVHTYNLLYMYKKLIKQYDETDK